MNRQELKTLFLANFSATPGVNFSDVQSATRNAMIEFFNLGELSPREIRIRRPELMALVEEVIDELLPEKLISRVGDFAEVISFARDAEVVFETKGRGKRRAFLTIKKGQRGGMYQTARLDDSQMTIETWTETVGVFVTLEEILLGKYSLADLMNNILDGFVEKLYVEVIEALQAAASSVPAVNVETASGFVATDLDSVIRVIAAYGSPVIIGFHKLISKINNDGMIGSSSPTLPTSDLDELKAKGFIGTYKGTPVVRIPNYITNEVTNATWMFDESFLFVLPVGSKPVKVALRGDMTILDTQHPSGSMEQNAHKMIGVGILLYNNIGIYEDSTI